MPAETAHRDAGLGHDTAAAPTPAGARSVQFAAEGSEALRDLHAGWIAQLREFARHQITPRAFEMDRRAELDPELVRELFAAGLMAIAAPSMYGGQGRSFCELALAIEEIGRACPGVAVAVDVHNALVTAAIVRHGTGDQKRRFLPRLATRSVGAFAISEEQAGSDALAVATRAEPDGRRFRISGRKRWTSNAHAAELFLLFAGTGGDCGGRLSAFLLEREAPGLTVGEPTDQLGVRAAATADLELDGVPVRREDAIGGTGRGDLVAVDAFAIGRVGIAAQLVGLAQGALDSAVAYAREREQFGSRIAGYQGVQFPLAASAAQIEAARALTYAAAAAVDRDAAQADLLRLSAMAKYVASRIAIETTACAVDTFGALGVVRGCVAEKLYRDARVGTIYEGTSNILLRSIAATLLRPTGQAS